MDYFIMRQDERLTNVVKMILPDFLGGGHLTSEQEQELPSTMVIFAKENQNNAYPDYIESPVMLISEKLKRMFSKYQEDIIFKTAVLVEKEINRQEVYYLISVPKIACVSETSVFDRQDHVQELVLDTKKVGNARIFCAADYENKMIVRLDVAESILRRDSEGIWFEKVNIDRKR